MGLVLAFQSTPRPASKTPQRRSEPSRGGADILFFTGVRFERHGAPAAGSARPGAAPDGVQPGS